MHSSNLTAVCCQKHHLKVSPKQMLLLLTCHFEGTENPQSLELPWIHIFDAEVWFKAFYLRQDISGAALTVYRT